MLVPTNQMIITALKDNEEDKYRELLNNSVKIDFSYIRDMSETSNKIVTCQNKLCEAVLSIRETREMLTLKEYRENADKFGEEVTITEGELKAAEADPLSKVWCCSYCGRFQLCRGDFDARFLPLKYIADEEEKKVSDEPIILFLIDSSGSMETAIHEPKSTQASKQLLELIQKSELVKKSQAQERRAMERVRKTFREKIPETNKYITKRHFMLGLISKVLRLIKNTVKSNKEDQLRKIGFIFFNDRISLVADGQNPNFPIIESNDAQEFDLNEYLSKPPAKERFRKADYYSFGNLFKLGQEYGQIYNTSIVDLNHEKIDFSDVITEGQTALGPAIAVALGITSKHGSGSSIVVVTDGFANMGILEPEVIYREAEQSIIHELRTQRCLMSILTWKETESKIAEQNTKNFNEFVDKNTDLIERYEVTLNMNEETINTILNALQALGLRKIIGVIRQSKIICSVDFVKFEKTKFEESMLSDGDILTSNKSYWLHIKLDKEKITEDNYNDPVLTQYILKFQDVSTKKIICIVSQIEQRLCKEVKKMIKLINFENIQEYFDKQDIKNFSERNTIRPVERTIREGINNYSESMRSRKMNVNEIRDSNEAAQRSFNTINKDRELDF